MFERPDVGERAILVHIDFTSYEDAEDPGEFRELVTSAGVEPVATINGSRKQPSPRLFVGEGKLEEIRDAISANGADVVLFNHALSPSQERNIERDLKCRVLDRTGVILDIFAQRARTHEGKLQVELAQLEHMSTRLVRGWTHLERQKGGIGLRGRVRPSLKLTDGYCASASNRSTSAWKKCAGSVIRAVAHELALTFQRFPWLVTPTPASRPCSTESPHPAYMPLTSCSQPSIRRCAGWSCRTSAP